MKTFCFCLPVRLGTLILSFFGLLGNALLTFGLIFQLHRINDPPKIVFIPALVFAIICGLSALFCLFGFVGAVLAKRRLVSLYATWLSLQITLSLIMGVAYIIVLFTKQGEIKDDCLKELNGVKDADKICSDFAGTNKWIFLACFLVQGAVQLYLVGIVRHYRQQLEESGGYYGSRNLAPSLLGNKSASGYGEGKSAVPLNPYQKLGDDDHHRSSAHLVPEKDLERGSFDDGRSSPYRAEYRDAYEDRH